MFDRTHRGLATSYLSTPHLPGGVAPTRTALVRHHYLEEKRARLEADATGRRRVATEQWIAYPLTWLTGVWSVAGRLRGTLYRPARGRGAGLAAGEL